MTEIYVKNNMSKEDNVTFLLVNWILKSSDQFKIFLKINLENQLAYCLLLILETEKAQFIVAIVYIRKTKVEN